VRTDAAQATLEDLAGRLSGRAIFESSPCRVRFEHLSLFIHGFDQAARKLIVPLPQREWRQGTGSKRFNDS